MAERSPWAAFLQHRDPNPPVEPDVILMGCTPFLGMAGEEAVGALDPRCPTCKGEIRPQDIGYYCLRCCRADPEAEVILKAARARTRKPPRLRHAATPEKKKTRKERRREKGRR